MSAAFDREEYEANLHRLYGRQTAIELMIEVFFANYFATLPETSVDDVAHEMKLIGRTISFPADTDMSVIRAMAIEIVTVVDRTIDKAVARAEGYREQLATQPANGNESEG